MDNFKELRNTYLAGEATPEEEEEYFRLLALDDPHNDPELDAIWYSEQQETNLKTDDPDFYSRVWEQVKAIIADKFDNQNIEPT
jgi:hypothetical protein